MRGKALLLLWLLAAPLPAAACDPLPDLRQEARAVALGAEIRCVVCQAESINDSAAGMARDLRCLVRERIAAGEGDDAIRNYLQDRYGDFILLRPPLQPNTMLLWLLPGVIFAVAGGLVLRFALRRGKGRAS
jgi:cytochrome c-type biogenesis protein CcmH